ncbi:hypothetical protein C6P46_006878 [Rhodotorula mucilaginosa]|uniref:Protein CPL1-like domain-containing protein n=1 Tax=Rhodotorula mucilaginosa TaxID=5537 RepID=A0A9P7B884_RHOMI|nr:hypothetical protein C6P46_006878 [Rhodotorula mucilaginosa]
MSNRILSIVSVLLAASTAVHAIGDFPCIGTTDSQSCAAWSTDKDAQGVISPDAVCQPDPVYPNISYCGYAHAACSDNTQCDYGSCGANGKCTGYLGDACTADNDCQAFFFCGTDGMCGGTDAPCANGLAEAPIPLPDQQCVSQSCDTASKKCAAMPSAGIPNGYPCSNSDICASGWCSPEKLVCSLAASQGARTRKRSTEMCPASQIACKVSVSAGFECIDPQTNLEQCGGCLADGTGIDCTAIPGAESVACEAGRCIVMSCAPGLYVNAAATACL